MSRKTKIFSRNKIVKQFKIFGAKFSLIQRTECHFIDENSDKLQCYNTLMFSYNGKKKNSRNHFKVSIARPNRNSYKRIFSNTV